MCDLTLCNLSTKCCKELVGRGLGLFRRLYANLRRKVKEDKYCRGRQCERAGQRNGQFAAQRRKCWRRFMLCRHK